MFLKAILAPVSFYASPTILSAFLAVVIGRLCMLHLGEAKTCNNITIRGTIPAVRGVIYDRGEHELAVNRIGYKVFVDPLAPVKEGQDKAATARRIADLVGRTPQAVYEDLMAEDGRRYIVEGLTFDPEAVDLVTNKSLYCCVGLEEISRRIYPQSARMAHILGFVSGVDQVGQNGGVEQRYNQYLTGTPGSFTGVKARNGREIRERRQQTIPPIDGANIYLTLDQNLQYVVREALARGMAEYGAVGARCIIESVKTGEILAMVSLPDYDPVNYTAFKGKSRKNRTISEIYDPGSTMKTLVVSAALNERIVTPDSRLDVGQGSWSYGGHILRDHPKGIIDIRTVIQKSSNIGAAKVGLLLGNRRLEAYLRAFGIGSQLGIDLPGEERGLLTPHEKWEMVKPTRISIGQGVSVTPLQMVNAYCSIANGGYLMKPYIVSKVVSPNGTTLLQNRPEVLGRPLRPETAEKMRSILRTVTEMGGTARRAAIEGYAVAGKTGTAQMVVKDENGRWGYSQRDYWASFCGFVPAEEPVFAAIVILDRPDPSKPHTGGVVAAPVFAEIASYTAQYLEIPIAVTIADNDTAQ